MPWEPTSTPSAPTLPGPEQGSAQDQAGLQAVLRGLSSDLKAKAERNAETQRQGSLRPATAETSTEYFARMEACTAQPASTHGGTLMHSKDSQICSALAEMCAVPMACCQHDAQALIWHRQVTVSGSCALSTQTTTSEAAAPRSETQLWLIAGTASALLGTMHEVGSSLTAQPGHYGQPEDLLAAWRQLSDTDSLVPKHNTFGGVHTSPQPDDELTRVTRAQLAASYTQEWAPEQARLIDDLMPDAYTSAMWDVSDSPSMLMGSPDQDSHYRLPYGAHASTLQSSQFLEFPGQLPQYQAWSPVLGDGRTHAPPPLSSSPQPGLSPGLLEFGSLEWPSMRSPQAHCRAELGSALGLQLSMAASAGEQGFEQPSEEDLYATLARFQEDCSQLPADHSDSNADLAAMSPPCSPTQQMMQQSASGPHSIKHDAVQEQDPLVAASEQEISAVANCPTAPSETDRVSSSRAVMYMDCLEPDGAADMHLDSLPQRTERLATCSDDEEFAVLDFGAASDGSSECSFRAAGPAAGYNNVYPAPR